MENGGGMSKNIEEYYYCIYECKECGKTIDENKLENHIKDCLGE
jgi:hypothetical protein